MLVPILRALDSSVVLAQTRGTSFATACVAAGGIYEVDTIDTKGCVVTTTYELEGWNSDGCSDARNSTVLMYLLRIVSVYVPYTQRSGPWVFPKVVLPFWSSQPGCLISHTWALVSRKPDCIRTRKPSMISPSSCSALLRPFLVRKRCLYAALVE